MDNERNDNKIYPVLGNVELLIRDDKGQELEGDKPHILTLLKKSPDTKYYLVMLKVSGIVRYIQPIISKQPEIKASDNWFMISVPDYLNHQEIEATRLLNATATIGNWYN